MTKDTPAPRRAGEMTAEERRKRILRRIEHVITTENWSLIEGVIEHAIHEAETAAYERGKAEGAADERERILRPLGYDNNGGALTSEEVWEGEMVTLSHDPYYSLAAALIDLERRNADPVCIRTIRDVQKRIGEMLAAIRQRTEGGDSNE